MSKKTCPWSVSEPLKHEKIEPPEEHARLFFKCEYGCVKVLRDLALKKGLAFCDQIFEHFSDKYTGRSILKELPPRHTSDLYYLERIILTNVVQADGHVILADTFSLLNHSCTSNTSISFDEDMGMVYVFATANICKDDQLFFSYLDESDLKNESKERIETLYRRYNFICDCSRCHQEDNTKSLQYPRTKNAPDVGNGDVFLFAPQFHPLVQNTAFLKLTKTSCVFRFADQNLFHLQTFFD